MSVYGKLEGVPGPITGKYAGYIEFESIAFGKARPGKPRSNNCAWVQLTKGVDSSSVALYRLSTSGEQFEAAFVIYQGSGNTARFTQYDIGRVFISNFSCHRLFESMILTVVRET